MSSSDAGSGGEVSGDYRAQAVSRFEYLCMELQQVALQHARRVGQAGSDSCADGVAVVVQKIDGLWRAYVLGNDTDAPGTVVGIKKPGTGASPESAVEDFIEYLKGPGADQRYVPIFERVSKR